MSKSQFTAPSTIVNPRRVPRSTHARSHWYPYYAGYSSIFAEQVIALSTLDESARIADPWNGGGTTTAVATHAGISAWGGDLNPAMVVVAKARVTPSARLNFVASIGELCAKGARYDICADGDPLGRWVSREVVAQLRGVETEVRHWCADQEQYPELPEQMSSEASLLYLALFRTARELAHDRRTSNPTWVKGAHGAIAPQQVDVRSVFLDQLKILTRPEESGVTISRGATLDVSPAERVPLKDDSVDLVLTSPPYCTRIDYAVATSIELAVLRISSQKQDALRRQMMGTTTVVKESIDPLPQWGMACNEFLARVQSHSSKASSGYYFKSHVQYFDSLSRSISEVCRVLKPGGCAVFVVQDSYYKEIRNNLALVTEEMFSSNSVRLIGRYDFPKLINMRSVHTKSRSYGGHAPPIESVLWLSK